MQYCSYLGCPLVSNYVNTQIYFQTRTLFWYVQKTLVISIWCYNFNHWHHQELYNRTSLPIGWQQALYILHLEKNHYQNGIITDLSGANLRFCGIWCPFFYEKNRTGLQTGLSGVCCDKFIASIFVRISIFCHTLHLAQIAISTPELVDFMRWNGIVSSCQCYNYKSVFV